MSKPKPGDIIEIPTAKGLAYAQYTHQHRQFGSLLRVFEKLFATRPQDFRAVANGTVRFSIFFPLSASIKRGIFNLVAHEEITPANASFPVFRDGIADPQTKKVKDWWLWDGEREWKVGSLTPEQERLPLRRVWNDTMLVERIEGDWKPSEDRG